MKTRTLKYLTLLISLYSCGGKNLFYHSNMNQGNGQELTPTHEQQNIPMTPPNIGGSTDNNNIIPYQNSLIPKNHPCQVLLRQQKKEYFQLKIQQNLELIERNEQYLQWFEDQHQQSICQHQEHHNKSQLLQCTFAKTHKEMNPQYELQKKKLAQMHQNQILKLRVQHLDQNELMLKKSKQLDVKQEIQLYKQQMQQIEAQYSESSE